jgi:hypothetical protein
MIEKYRKKHFLDLLEFLKKNFDSDFYYTSNNSRVFIKESKQLKEFLKNTDIIYLECEKGDIIGVIAVWKSLGNNVKRYYVKISSRSNITSKNLLTILLWNFYKELYIKIKKNSKYYSILRDKKFDFVGDRGSELLLHRNKTQENANHYNFKDSDSDIR